MIRKEGAVARAKIDVIELVGRELHMVLSIGDHSINVLSDPTSRFKVDSEVWFSFNPHNIHLFDGSGKLVPVE
jgi:ABC-type sugar transport system ATPase subunit